MVDFDVISHLNRSNHSRKWVLFFEQLLDKLLEKLEKLAFSYLVKLKKKIIAETFIFFRDHIFVELKLECILSLFVSLVFFCWKNWKNWKIILYFFSNLIYKKKILHFDSLFSMKTGKIKNSRICRIFSNGHHHAI